MTDFLQPALAAVEAKYASADHSRYPLDHAVAKAKVRGMLRAYDTHWESEWDRYEIVGVERQLLAPIKSLATGKDTGYQAGGKIDVSIKSRKNGKHGILDHKFLASQFDQDDLSHLLIDGQPKQYAYLEWFHGNRIEFAVWDCIAKPGLKPSKERSKVIKAAKPERIHKRTGETLPAVAEERETTPAETLEEYEQRVYENMLENPSNKFRRMPIPITKEVIANHLIQLYAWTNELHIEGQGTTHLHDENGCYQYGRWCHRLSICSGQDSEDSGNWTVGNLIHPELALAAGVDPAKVITNSRLKTYRRCRLLHDADYNRGVRKKNHKTEESLFVGDLAHVGLEHYFLAIKERQEGR